MSNYAIVGKGLQFVFYSIIISILAALPIPLISPLLAIAAPIVAAYGYSIAAKGAEAYRGAMNLTIATIVLAVLSFFLGLIPILGGLITLTATICSVLVVHIVCATTTKLLDQCGQVVAPRGTTVWKIYLICMLVVMVVQFLMIIPIINLLGLFLSVPVGIVGLIAGILYILFVWNSQKALQGV